MSEKSLDEKIRLLDDEKINSILETPDDYLPEAVLVAIEVAKKRNLPIPKNRVQENNPSFAERGYFDKLFSGIIGAYRDFLPGNFTAFLILSVFLLVANVFVSSLFIRTNDPGIDFLERLSTIFSGGYIDSQFPTLIGNLLYTIPALYFYKRKTMGLGSSISVRSLFSDLNPNYFAMLFAGLIAGAACIIIFLNLYYAFTGNLVIGLYISEDYYFMPILTLGKSSPGLASLLSFLVLKLFIISIFLVPSIVLTAALKKDFKLSFLKQNFKTWMKILGAILLLNLLFLSLNRFISTEMGYFVMLFNDFGTFEIYILVLAALFIQALLMPLGMAVFAMPFIAAGVLPDKIESYRNEDPFGDAESDETDFG